MIPQILIALVPLLVSQAESLFQGGERGQEKRQWVHDALHEAEPLMKKIAPDWLDKQLPVLEGMIDTAIEFALDKLEE